MNWLCTIEFLTNLSVSERKSTVQPKTTFKIAHDGCFRLTCAQWRPICFRFEASFSVRLFFFNAWDHGGEFVRRILRYMACGFFKMFKRWFLSFLHVFLRFWDYVTTAVTNTKKSFCKFPRYFFGSRLSPFRKFYVQNSSSKSAATDPGMVPNHPCCSMLAGKVDCTPEQPCGRISQVTWLWIQWTPSPLHDEIRFWNKVLGVLFCDVGGWWNLTYELVYTYVQS